MRTVEAMFSQISKGIDNILQNNDNTEFQLKGGKILAICQNGSYFHLFEALEVQ
jgi:hypothetical protein